MAGRAPSSEHARRGATAIVEALRARGHVAYFAGGCVRDELLGLSPSDYDVATDATPDRVREIWPKSDLVGACFGVVLVKQRVEEAWVVVEVATFRSDGAYTDARRPDSVRFSTPEADATMSAPASKRYGSCSRSRTARKSPALMWATTTSRGASTS